MALIRINHRPPPRQLLVFAIAWAIFVAALGWILWSNRLPMAAKTCWILALAVPLAGSLWREGLRLLYVGLTYATFPIGWLVSSTVLVVLYYGLLTPIGLLLRIWRHDPLQQTPKSRADSYWRPRQGGRPASSYFRQH